MFDLKDSVQIQDLEKLTQGSVSKKNMIPNSPHGPLYFHHCGSIHHWPWGINFKTTTFVFRK